MNSDKDLTHPKYRPKESYLDNTTKTILLVDYSNLLYRAWFVSAKRPWVAYCKFFDMLRLAVKRSKQEGVPIEVIFCGESRTPLKRKKLAKDYKGHRDREVDPKFGKFRKDLEVILDMIGWPLICADGYEADDVIASIVNQTCHRCLCKTPCVDCDCALQYTTDVFIFSGDRDLQQCLAWDRVYIYRAPGLIVTRETFEAEYQIPVKKYNVYKALIGDKSDNIKGVNGFGPVKARVAINAGTVSEDIWESGEDGAAKEFRKALNLVKLEHDLPIDISTGYFGAPKLDEEAFNKAFDERITLEIKRLIEEFYDPKG